MKPVIGIVMGSTSDWETMKAAAKVLEEFGLDDRNQVVLIDEILTADSSRFWPADQYQVGTSPPSYDKQFVRDYLETLDWNKTAPGPSLPAEIIRKTSEKYEEALRRLTA